MKKCTKSTASPKISNLTILLDTGLNTEQRGLAETIRSSGEALLGLLNDILDFSKIEAGNSPLKKSISACAKRSRTPWK
jgi:signal transduction histidine kinase